MSERQKTLTLLAQWAQKLGLPVEELQKKFQEQLLKLKAAVPNKPEDWYERRARFFVYRDVKTMLRYPNVGVYDGVFFGYNAKMDVFARRRQQALALFKSNPAKAIDEGWTNETGKPIFKLPSGGVIDISEPIYLRQSVGLFRPASGGNLKLGVIVHRMEQADNVPPMLVPVRCSLRKTSDFPDKYVFSSLRTTKYEPISMPEFPEPLDEGKACEILMKAPDSLKVTCSTIRQWHMEHRTENTRICLLEADVVFIRREPTRTGNAMFVVEDETMLDLTAEGVTVWVHPEIFGMMNFGAGSRVIVVGRTVAMPAWDPTTRQIDRTRTRIGINAFGIYAIPEYRVPPEEESVIGTEFLQ